MRVVYSFVCMIVNAFSFHLDEYSFFSAVYSALLSWCCYLLPHFRICSILIVLVQIDKHIRFDSSRLLLFEQFVFSSTIHGYQSKCMILHTIRAAFNTTLQFAQIIRPMYPVFRYIRAYGTIATIEMASGMNHLMHIFSWHLINGFF